MESYGETIAHKLPSKYCNEANQEKIKSNI